MRDEDIPRWLVVLGVAVVVIPLLMMSMMMGAMGGPAMGGPMGGQPMMGPGGGPGIFRFLGVVPLAIALVVGYAGYRTLQAEPGRTDESTADPVERLRERYVAGEISEEEFERELERELGAVDADEPTTNGAATERQPEFER